MITFDLSEATSTIDEETRDLIADLVLAWARYDSLVTHWAIRSFGMGIDEGSIFIGNMDTKTKLDRLKALHAHFGLDAGSAKIGELIKFHKANVDVRNAVCHKACAGHMRSDPDRLIFSTAKPYPKQPGKMLVELIHLDQIRNATTFAKTNADSISKLVDGLVAKLEERRGQSGEHPQDSQPSPQPS